ncbi:MAG: hypothetical protein FWC36_06905 [Spirochaetes bacterium]|nr:hypothetical protein [Spirochaetota bacterium]
MQRISIKSWEGFQILLIEKSMDNRYIYRKLLDTDFFDEVISKYNTQVAYTNYNTLTYMTVDRIENRFNPQDPRFSNFLRRVPEYFKAYVNNKPFSVYYLRTEADYWQTSAVVESVLGNNYNWIIPKYENNRFGIILLFLYLMILSIFVYNNKKKWFVHLLHSVPWVFLIYFNGENYFFTAVFMLFVLRLLLLIEKKVVEEYINYKTISIKKHFDEKAFLIIGIAIFSLIIPAFAPMISHIVSYMTFSALPAARPGSFVTPLFILLFELCFFAMLFLVRYRRVAEFSHKIFCAISIKKEKENVLSLDIKSFALICFLSMATLPLYFFGHPVGYAGGQSLKYPMPAAIHTFPASGLTLAFLEKVSRYNEKRGFLPGYCEYIRHLAFQMRLPFKMNYSFPYNNEKVTISYYFFDAEKNIFKNKKVMINQFTDIWLNDNVIADKNRGITGLMLSNTGLIQAAPGTVVPDAPIFIIPVIFGFLYSILFYFLFGTKKAQIMGSRKKVIFENRRRKQQAA